MTSPYQAHIEKWKNCTRCLLHEGRNKVVFARGDIPCDVLFVGEAPGTNENATGLPFDGPAGIKLDEMIRIAVENITWEPRIGYYNLVSCFPRQEKEAGTNEPPKEAIQACASKLREFIVIAAPALIVNVGKLSEKWVPDGMSGLIVKGKNEPKWCSITHPAAILRAPAAQQSLMVKQSIIRLAEAFKSL